MENLITIREEINQMAELALSMLKNTFTGFMEHDLDILAAVLKDEERLNEMEKALTLSLADISKSSSPADKKNIMLLANIVADLEEIGDYVKDMIERIEIKIQEKELNVARANILGAKSEFLPQLSSQASYTHNGTVLNVGSSIATSSKKDLGVVTGYENDNKLGVSLDQIIYNGGANIANLKQNQLNLKVAEQTLRATKLDVEFETKRLYYGVLLAYETLRITQELVDQAQLHYENVKDKFEHGTASRFDMLQSKVHVAKLLPELVKARNAVKLMKEDLISDYIKFIRGYIDLKRIKAGLYGKKGKGFDIAGIVLGGAIVLFALFFVLLGD